MENGLARSWPSLRFTPHLTLLEGEKFLYRVLGDHVHCRVAEWRPCLGVVELGLSVAGGQKLPRRSETHRFVPSA